MKLKLLLLSIFSLSLSVYESKAQCQVFAFVNITSACGIIGSATGVNTITFMWDFGDASAGTGNAVTHNYAANGTYNVCCIGLDSTGFPCDTSCTSITITGCNAASCTVASTQIPNGPCGFTFIASGTATTYGWTFGDSQTGTGATVQHTYAGNGTYQVCVVGYDALNVPCDTFCMTAVVTNCASSSCTIVGTQIPNGPCSFTFIASGIGVSNYTWTFGDSGTGTGATVQHTYTANGTYNVCVVGYDSSMVPCDTFCQTVTLTGCTGASCTVVATSITISPCTVQFIANGIGAANYSWTFGDTQTGTGATTQHTYSANGTYTVCCVAIDANGNPCDTSCFPVTITGCVSSISEYAATEIALYPNPVNQSLNVKLNDQSALTAWTITDIAGRVVLSGTVASSLFTVNTAGLPEGSYLMLFYGENNSVAGVRQIVKSE